MCTMIHRVKKSTKQMLFTGSSCRGGKGKQTQSRGTAGMLCRIRVKCPR